MQLMIKRIFDLFFSLLFIIILSPLWLIIVLLIKIDSKGPVLYRHKRVGKQGKEFFCLKFRSMLPGADPNKLVNNPDDKRVTKVGYFLRQTSLDETPQLINVFTGDMSIVGPRPPLPSQVREFSRNDFDKLKVKPGLTGWTQVNGRNLIDYKKRMELDAWYANNWNLFLDLRILLKTPLVIFKREGIYDAR